MGPQWVVYRVWRVVRSRLHLYPRRLLPRPWKSFGDSEFSLDVDWIHPRAAADWWGVQPESIKARMIDEADRILDGEICLFSKHWVSFSGGTDWHRNLLTGEEFPAQEESVQIGDFERGDIKGVWEASRFSWVFPLARAFVVQGRPEYRSFFRERFIDWCAMNPPNIGVNWKCGQEASLRLFAVLFAHAVLKPEGENYDLSLKRFLRATAERIEADIEYALSQKNNHGISEAVGLLTVAVLLEDDPKARCWWESAIRALEEQLAELVYTDGAFSQHSFNYQRLALHYLVWAMGVVKYRSRSAPLWLFKSGARLVKHLKSFCWGGETVSHPNFGSNDGAHLFQISDLEYGDFRPDILLGSACFGLGGGDAPAAAQEPCVWFGFTPPGDAIADEPFVGVKSSESGYHHVKGGDWQAFVFLPKKFIHRPSQADILHADIWFRGTNIAVDPGTYSYNDSGPYAQAFKLAAFHNRATVNRTEPMHSVSRFLYLPWPNGDCRREGKSVWRGESPATTEGHIRIDRKVSILNEQLIVEDFFYGKPVHSAQIHWLLADYPIQFKQTLKGVTGKMDLGGTGILKIEVQTSTKASFSHWRAGQWVAGESASQWEPDNSPRGWISRYYSDKQPAHSLILETGIGCSGFRTVFAWNIES